MTVNYDDFKKISIRGRLAYGAKCLENALASRKIENPWLDKLLDIIWQFTETMRMDVWLEDVNELTPYNVLDPFPGALEHFTSMSLMEAEGLKRIYQSLPPFIVEMIDEVILIGKSNIYGGVVDYSEMTYKPLIGVINIMKSNNIELPGIEPFMRSQFHEDHGWGNPHARWYYISE